MRPVYKRVGYGRIVAGEYDWDWAPDPVYDGYPVILCHGAGTIAQYSGIAGSGIIHRPSAQLPYYLGWRGIPSIAGQMGGDTFANNAVMGYMSTTRTLLGTLGYNNEKVHLFGGSMGFGVAMRWAKENPTLVASLTGMIPLTNLNYLYTNNIGGLQASIAGAWGVVAPAALPAAADLYSYADEIAAADFPVRLYYSDPDTLIRPVDVTGFGAACGAEVVLQVGTNGHTVASERDTADLGSGTAWEWYADWIKSLAA